MIRSACLGITASLTLALLTPPGHAQPERPVAPETQQLFDDAPRVGDTIPDVQLHTDTGDPFRSSALKGKYTVLVFGCLT